MALRALLRQFADFMPSHGGDFKYSCTYDLVEKEGKEFPNVVAPHITLPGFRIGELKQCFSNTTNLVLEDAFRGTLGLVYVEGFVLAPNLGLPVHHAWAVTPGGVVVDPTLRWRGKYGRDRSDHEYLGLEIPMKMLAEIITTKGTYGVLNNWEQDYPELKTTWRSE